MRETKWERWAGTLPTQKRKPLVVESGIRYGPFVVWARVTKRNKADIDLLGNTAYSVDHLPSGTHIIGIPIGQQALAKGIVIELLDLPGVDWDASPLTLSPEDTVRAWEICHPPPVRRKRRAEDYAPLVWAPEYPGYFGPSDDLATYDRANAKALNEGKPPPYIRQAAALLREEYIMARFTVGKKAPLSREDLYEGVKGSRAFASPQLPPGFPTGYEGVKRIIEGLWKLGGEIHALADAMITFWEHSQVGKIDSDVLPSQWAAWEGEYKRLVIKGVCNWSICAVMYDTLPRGDKAKIEGKLGYVGNHRQGYAALGRKTFLRSPLLPKLREYRRLRLLGAEQAYEELDRCLT